MANIFDRDYSAANKTHFQQVEDIAKRSSVPVNVLLAMGETANVSDPDDLVSFAQNAAGELGPQLQAGGDIRAIIREAAGEKSDAFFERARQIGDELYPERMQAERAQRQQAAAGEGRRSVGEDLALGARQYPEALISGAGRQLQILGFDETGQAMVDFADRTLGQDEAEAARSAAISESNTIWQNIVDATVQSSPGIAGDIGMSVAGAAAGAKIGAIAGPKGAVVGGALGAVAGAAASIFPQMLDSAWSTAEENEHDVNDPEVQTRIMGTAIATSLAQTLFPAGVGRALQRPINEAAEGVVRNVIARGAQGAARGSLLEGTAEASALVIEQVMFDKDIQAAISRDELRAIGPLLVEKHGEAAIIAFGAGALLGGPIGGAVGANEQAGVNRAVRSAEGEIPEVLAPIYDRAEQLEARDLPGLAERDRSAFMRGVMNELNGTEASLTDAEGGYDDQGRTAAQQRAYDKGVEYARREAGTVAEGIRTKAETQAQPDTSTGTPAAPGAAAEDALAAPPVRPGSLRDSMMQGATRSAPQANTAVGMVSPNAVRDGGGTASEVSGIPAPQQQAPADPTNNGAAPMVWVQIEGERQPMAAEVLIANDDGYELMDPTTGQVYQIPRADVEAGMVQITPRDEGGSGQDQSPQLVEDAGSPLPSEYDQMVFELGRTSEMPDMSIDLAGRALSDVASIANEFGEGEDLRKIRVRLEEIYAAKKKEQLDAITSESQVSAPQAGPAGDTGADPLGELGAGMQGAGMQGAPDAASTPDLITRANGEPYKSETALTAKIKRDGLNADEYRIEPRNEGFVAVRQAEKDQDDAVLDGIPAGDQGIAPGRPDNEEGSEGVAPLAGQQPDSGGQPPDGADGGRGIPDAVGTGEPVRALSEQQNETQETAERLAPDGQPSIGATPEIDAGFSENRAALGKFKKGMRVQYVDDAFTPPRTVTGTVSSLDRRSGQGQVVVRGDSGSEFTIGARILTPADDASVTPTPADRVEDQAPGPASTPVVENIRERAAIVRGVSEDQPPQVDGVSLKWDTKEQGFIFSRKHVDKVQAAIDATSREANPNLPTPQPEPTPPTISKTGSVAPDAGPTAEQFDQIAAETNPNPTPAQAEAENYKTAKTDWRGMKLSIENRKGTVRSKKTPDGKTEWSVTMPAHYGRILRTEGADGDHVDFYMGDDTNSDRVFVVDQKDAETGAFDEHKVMLGFGNQQKAREAYLAGFSDGKGSDRWGGVTAMSVADLGAALNDKSRWQKPMKMVVPEVSTNREMTTEDGYRVVWDDKGTTFFHPRGPGIRATMERLTDAQVTEYLDSVRKPETDMRIVAKFKDTPTTEPKQSPPSARKKSKEKQDETAAVSSDMQPEATTTPAKALKGLNEAENAELAALEAQFLDKIKTQMSSGLDPELVSVALKIGTLYVRAGRRRFRDLITTMMERMGLPLERAQPYARNAYNQIRDDMDLAGDDVADMDTSADVMAEVRKMRAEEARRNADASALAETSASDNVDQAQKSEAEGDQSGNRRTDRASTRQGAGDPAPREGQADGTRRGSDEPGGQERGVRPDGQQRPSAERDAARDGAAGRSGRADEQLGPRDHIIEPGGLTLARGEKTRARESIAALRTLRAIQSEGRTATAEERASLAKYGGAGTLAGTLPRSDGSVKFPDLASEIDGLLNAEEKATLSRTSQYAFYTAESALRGMWGLARQLGFNGGRVYEPGMGVGGFAGTIPADVREQTSYQGLELDLVTAQIAKALYPRQNIRQGDFIKTPLAQNHYDLVIGNPPFSGTKIQADPAYPQGFMIHDYFFAKSLDSVRPGGLLMFITSAGTMNKGDTSARDYLADRADLVGAIRLPNTAFKENGTEVTTDIIVLRKRADGEKEADATWRESVKTDLPDGDGGTGQALVNRYFLENPDMILGEQGLYDTLTTGARVGVRPKPGADLRADLSRAAQAFPRDIMSVATPSAELGAIDAASPETKRGGYYLKDGTLHQFNGTEGVEIGLRSKANPKGIAKADNERIMELVPIKMALRDVYAADLDEKDASAARKRLNDAYDAFVERFGPINKEVRTERRPSRVQIETIRQRAAEDARSRGEDFDIGSFDAGPMIEAGAKMAEIARARAEAMESPDYREGDFNPSSVPDMVIVKRPNIEPFIGNQDRLGDQEGYRLRAIEHINKETGEASKAAVFTQSAVRKTKKPEINSPEDALLYTLAERGRIDIGAIAKLAKVSEEAVISDLKGKIFRNPGTGGYETRAKYLSGNVRKKLREAEQAARNDPTYAGNVRDLIDVQPDPIPASDIRVPVGAHWFDAATYGEFARSKGLQLTASFKPSLGIWTVDGDTRSAEARNDWGTEDLPFADLMRLIMNNKSIQVRRTHTNADGTKETRLDEEATQAAQDKAQEIRSDFSEWFWSDEGRAAKMEALYNETFNSEVAPKFDGSYLTTPGVNSLWSWRPHQSGVIARILQTGNTYMAHTVGAGKTSAMIGAGMEARRLGLARKPMYSVPNHMLDQFATEFFEQYPLANVAIADESRFHTSRRKEFVADIAMNDYDAVVITHSALELIPPSESAVGLAVADMLQDVREVYDSTGAGDRGIDQALLGSIKSIAGSLGVNVKDIEGAKTNTRKKIEQLLEAAEQKIQRQTSSANKDQVFSFDEIGVDMLFVDEAHLFRKLSFATQNGNIKGIDPNGSAASMDLFIKTRVVEQNNPGRGLILASGTPITNTMAELYSLSRYIQPQALADRGVSSFDAWAATFGMTETALEQDPAGGYKQVTRFAKFLNTPELSLMVRQTMDIVSGADLEQYVTRPKLKGGKRNLVVVEPSPHVKAYQQGLAARMEAISQRKGPVKKGDDILLSVINDGRLAAIDMRLVDPDATGDGSKLEAAIQKVFRNWQKGADTPFYGVKKEGGYTDKPVMRGPSTQIVFSTLGVNPSRHNPGFSVHRFIKSELIRLGVAADEILLAEDLNSHGKRQRAFNDLNDGKKRILIGSKTLFTGMNAQRRIAAIHNLDPLWYPSDDEQRNGRGIRQGNMNPEIEINDYSTKGTYDATMWQMMGRKAAFIEAFYRGDPTVREMEDLGEASQFEQAKAMTTADPRVQVLTDMKAQRDTLTRRKNASYGQRRRLDQQERSATRAAEAQEAELPVWQQMAARVVDTKGDAFKGKVGDTDYDSRSESGNALISIADNMLQDTDGPVRADVGEVGGFPIQIKISRGAQTTTFLIPILDEKSIDVGWTIDPVGLMRRLENAVQGLKQIPASMEADIAEYREKAQGYRQAQSRLKDFAEQEKLDELEQRIDDLEGEMLSETKEEKQSRFDEDGLNLNFSGERDNEAMPYGWGEVEPDAPVTPAQMRQIVHDVHAEMKSAGLDGKIPAKVVEGLSTASGISIQGAFRTYQSGRTEILVNPDSADSPVGTLRHEIVHALRDPGVWGKPYGLFTKAEWQGLVAAARANRPLMTRIDLTYPDLNQAARLEEGVAEMYRMWARNMDQRSGLDRAFQKMRAFFSALAGAFRGQGFNSAAQTFESIASGRMGGRGPGGPSGAGARRPDGCFASNAARYSRQLVSDGGKITGAKERGVIGQMLTDAMGGKSDRYNILALMPGEPLFEELGKNLPSARKYVGMKHALSAMRNERQATAADVMDEWRGFMSKNPKSNTRLMELMHDATIAGLDPEAEFEARPKRNNEPKAEYDRDIKGKQEEFKTLRQRWEVMPKPAQAIYRKVRGAYREAAYTERGIILDNVSKAMELNLKRAKQRYADDLERIKEDGLTGDVREVAVAEAKERLAAVQKRDGYGRKSRLNSLRLMFEQNEVDAPYFPLMRHGNYYATVKDADGKVVAFSKFESEAAQRKAVAELRREYPDETIKLGTMAGRDGAAPEVDPNFVADVEALIGATVADPVLMDAIWQRYLETLPDFSMRKSRMHRKGTPGFTNDAFRNYARQMFHSAHQLARLKYGQDMQMALDDARREADGADDPNRATLVVNEMDKRHQWIMNPQTSAWSTWATSAAFVYYLGATPGAALVNLSQSVIVGIPVLAAAFKGATVGQASRQMMRGLREFAMGKGRLSNSKHLSPDDRAALQRAHDAGIIEKSQAHDLAGIAESGVEYSDVRARMMRPIAWMFHNAERMNREITFIAAFRLARQHGKTADQAYTDGARLTWKIHFNYESDSRPRLQFNDTIRVFTTFRNFQLNMLYRLFRDTHQSFNGETPEAKREARAQVIGITGMMMLMAGVSGTWGYALLMTLLGVFAEGGAEEIEEEIKEGLVNTLGADVAGLILKGVPGHLTGTNLSSRIGMPELWFRRPQRQEEGQELYQYWVEQLIGPVPAIASNAFRGYSMAKEGEIWRGVETASPKFVRDYMRAARYSQEGVTTFNGNTIIEDISAGDALTQALGFTPAKVSERYQTNSVMKNAELRIRRQRSRILGGVWDDVSAGNPVSARSRDAIRDWNAEHPEYPITADTLRQSMAARQRGQIETVDGIRINSRLDQSIREGAAPTIYQ